MSAMVSLGMRRSRSPCAARAASVGISARARAMISACVGMAALSSHASTGLLFKLDRLEVARQHDLQHLAIVRIAGDLMLAARRLQPGIARLHGQRALAFHLSRDPA